MVLPIYIDPNNPFLDIHTGKGKGSCTFAGTFECRCACGGLAHAQLLRLALIMQDINELPTVYRDAIKDATRKAKDAVQAMPTPIYSRRGRHKGDKSIDVFFLNRDVARRLIEHCRTVDILQHAHHAKTDSYSYMPIAVEICKIVQQIGADIFGSLSPHAGAYAARSHLVCDILASITSAFCTQNGGQPIQDQPSFADSDVFNELIQQCKMRYSISRNESLGFGPCKKNRSERQITERLTRKQRDQIEARKSYDDGDSLSEALIDTAIDKIIIEIRALYREATNISIEDLRMGLQITTVLFCPDPSVHKQVWDTCFSPVFHSEVCDGLRAKLNHGTLFVMEQAKIDCWDEGEASRWIQY